MIAGPQFQYIAASTLWLHAKFLNTEAVELLLGTLHSVDASHKGTIRELDKGLANLLENTHTDRAVDFITSFLASEGTSFSLSDFPRFGRSLLKGRAETLHNTLIRWLLLGVPSICNGLNSILRRGDLSAKAIDLSHAGASLSSDQQTFICRKAIGYFFLTPIVPSSIILSMLRNCSDEKVAEQMRQLLFDPLLLNFGGAVGDYLRSIDISDPSHPHALAVLKLGEQYLSNLRSVGSIKEIRPSEHELQLARLRLEDEVKKAHRKAEQQSVFLNLVSRSVLLYGRRSIAYIQGPNDEHRAVETELQEISTSMEIPRMEIVDPVGLDRVLLSFRAERSLQ